MSQSALEPNSADVVVAIASEHDPVIVISAEIALPSEGRALGSSPSSTARQGGLSSNDADAHYNFGLMLIQVHGDIRGIILAEDFVNFRVTPVFQRCRDDVPSLHHT
jgi:hypothetical protein